MASDYCGRWDRLFKGIRSWGFEMGMEREVLVLGVRAMSEYAMDWRDNIKGSSFFHEKSLDSVKRKRVFEN